MVAGRTAERRCRAPFRNAGPVVIDPDEPLPFGATRMMMLPKRAAFVTRFVMAPSMPFNGGDITLADLEIDRVAIDASSTNLQELGEICGWLFSAVPLAKAK